MIPECIAKGRDWGPTAPNLAHYERDYAAFSWRRAREALTGLPGGGLNIAYEAVDRHAAGGRAWKAGRSWHARS